KSPRPPCTSTPYRQNVCTPPRLQHRVNTFSIAPAGTPRKIFQLALNAGVSPKQKVSIPLLTLSGRSGFSLSRTTRPSSGSSSSGNVRPKDARVGRTYLDRPLGHMAYANLGSSTPSFLSLPHEAISAWSWSVMRTSPVSPSLTRPS
ncbi:unnamed protein product, partial [Ectocarpus sp. 13 AM-2016]